MMITLYFLLIPVWGNAFEMKVGDILLQPRDCWSCYLIEAQENSIYSHMGIVLETTPELKVMDSLGTVKVQSYEAFNKGTSKTRPIAVYRFRNSEILKVLETRKTEFQTYYMENFDGLKYDHDFLWNNIDEEGNEKLYCSEVVTKLLQGFLRIELPMKIMKFDKNRDAWIKYFKGVPPDGKWGNAPADFEKSDLFYEVGEL